LLIFFKLEGGNKPEESPAGDILKSYSPERHY
jgi:hypothetical protein